MQKATSFTCSPQSTNGKSVRDNQEKLYILIKKRVKRSYLVRRLATVDDVAADIFILLVEQNLPLFESEEFENLLTKTVNLTVRKLIRRDREMLDIDELGENEHPFYEMDFFSEEENFELVFAKFCESRPEPERTVFSLSRILPKKNIAVITGLGRNTVARLIKSIPEHFRDFLERSKIR